MLRFFACSDRIVWATGCETLSGLNSGQIERIATYLEASIVAVNRLSRSLLNPSRYIPTARSGWVGRQRNFVRSL